MEMFWDWTDMVVAQHSECFKTANLCYVNFTSIIVFNKEGWGGGWGDHDHNCIVLYHNSVLVKVHMEGENMASPSLDMTMLAYSSGRHLVHQGAPQCENHTSG